MSSPSHPKLLLPYPRSEPSPSDERRCVRRPGSRKSQGEVRATREDPRLPHAGGPGPKTVRSPIQKGVLLRRKAPLLGGRGLHISSLEAGLCDRFPWFGPRNCRRESPGREPSLCPSVVRLLLYGQPGPIRKALSCGGFTSGRKPIRKLLCWSELCGRSPGLSRVGPVAIARRRPPGVPPGGAPGGVPIRRRPWTEKPPQGWRVYRRARPPTGVRLAPRVLYGCPTGPLREGSAQTAGPPRAVYGCSTGVRRGPRPVGREGRRVLYGSSTGKLRH